MAPPKSVSVGAQKAYAAMVQQYGPELGAKVFYAKGGGGGPALNARVSSYYKTGGKQK
jgi:hypothetical protein